MIQNKYFIINLPEPGLNAILEHTIENINTLRSNNDKTKHIVKLPVGSTIPNSLQNKTSYNHDKYIVFFQLNKYLYNR